MKKIPLVVIAILLLIPVASKAQTNTFPTSGNVGINTYSTPSEKLEIGFGSIRITHNDPGNRLMWYRSDNTHPTGFGSDGYSILKFITNGTERMTLGGGGSLGIGTTSPQELLDVSGNIRANRLRLGNTSSNNIRLWVNSDNPGSGVTDWIAGSLGGTAGDRVVMGLLTGVATIGSHNSSLSAWSNLAINPDGGKVGIGTFSPFAKLQVGTSTNNTGSQITMFGGAASGGAVNALSLVNSATAATGNEVNMTFHTAGNYSPMAKISAIAESVQPVTDLAFSTYNSVTGITEQMRILGNGYVGIGTSTPHEALSVNGTIRSKEIKVETANWPDYVFKPTYQLPSLASVKAYIDQNQHLPEMPSEQDVAKNGINLGEMVRLQTKKIEELTLYLLKENEAKQAQQKEIDELRKQVETLLKKKP